MVTRVPFRTNTLGALASDGFSVPPCLRGDIVADLLKPRLHQPILLPANRSYWPGREFLAWHRHEHGFKTT
jgi:hypothetical protein